MSEKIEFDEYSMFVQKKYEYDWYDWCIFVSGDAAVMSAIQSVEYTLHQSFPDPIRLVKSPSDCFALYSAGWGGFNVGVKITFTDGATAPSSYFLKLLGNWPLGSEPPAPSAEEQAVYRTLIHEKFRWRKMSTILSKSALPEPRVLELLRGMEAQNVVRKAYFKSVDNQDMWGATSVVGLAPRPA
jgi:transcription initiation factor IIF auxiliary subunit